MKFAEIIFLQKTGQKDNILTYHLPDDMEAKVGQSAIVSLRNRQVFGIIWRIHENTPSFKTLGVTEIRKSKPLLSENQLELISWIKDYYFCPIQKILKLFIPARIFKDRPMRLNKKNDQQNVDQINRTPIRDLTEQQTKTIQEIIKGRKNKFLIHGVTGSGKTEIYARLAEHHLNQNKQVLILVPEISLTPQTIEYFEKSLGLKATVINSRISEGEKYLAWQKIWNNEAKLIIGSRSAIFSPFQDLGIIIMDEEHESSYKQDNSPRYNTHAVAEKMLEFFPEMKLVLGSATPSIETAEKYQEATLKITERIGKTPLPDIEIIDLREEFKKQNYSIFSDRLKEELQKVLDKKQQAILFLNRRGTASSIVCRDCGEVEKCQNCETNLTYHSKNLGTGKLICHYCGNISTPPTICKKCKGTNIRFLGIGTQKIEAEVLKEFPGARVLRADKDTTQNKHGFAEIYKKFRNHEADILIGTQMIAKGLHLPEVSLVGVILADIGLNIPDYKTAERNFQLLTQVAGRAGRSKIQGKVIIQTYNPENITLLCAQSHDYDKFFKLERTQRQLLKNPPFTKLAKILILSKSLADVKKQSENLHNLLWKIARESNITKELEINFYPAYLSRLNQQYRYIVLIKADNPQTLLAQLPKEYIMTSNIKIDIDPITTT